MTDVRFSTAIQLLLTLALAEAEGYERLSSSQLAKGLDANPTFVRKLLSPLAEAGLVESSLGRDGGVQLGRRPEKISLEEVYEAVLNTKLIWERRVVPHRCLVSCNIERYFGRLTVEADEAVRCTLRSKTLASELEELRALDTETRRRQRKSLV